MTLSQGDDKAYYIELEGAEKIRLDENLSLPERLYPGVSLSFKDDEVVF